MEEMHFVELWFVEMIHVLGAPKTITHVEKGWPSPPLKFQKRKISYNRIAAGFGDPANHLKCILYHGKPPINA